ncbi:apolipoprotein N-acyltransferase [Frankia casuarinae]|nr:apolipoprotein N-acyltransferase [Frankia sp. CcI6]EYT91081.1 apolipoprotein N-acyltransferase [Frankia casuarinae]
MLSTTRVTETGPVTPPPARPPHQAAGDTAPIPPAVPEPRVNGEPPVNGEPGMGPRPDPADPQPTLRSTLRSTLIRHTRRPLAALLGGALLYLATPPVGCWPLAPVAVTLLTLAVRNRRLRASYGLGLLFSLAFCIPLLRFVSFVGADGWLVLSLAEAAILALVAPATTLVWRLPGAWLWTAAVWVAQEALRSRAPFGGFPWGRLAFTQPDSPFTALAALGGAPAVTAAVAATGALTALTIVRITTPARGTPTPRTLPTAATARRLAAPILGTAALTLTGLLVPLPTAPEHGTLTVAAIQGNVPADGGYRALGRAFQVTANHVTVTRHLATDVTTGTHPQPDLVLWPENSSDLDPLTNPAVATALRAAARTAGAPLLVGAVLGGPGPGHLRNAGMIWTADGFTGQMYVKRHPVPFAEYLPGRALLEKLIHRFADEMPSDFLAGTTPGALHAAGTTIGDIICFEVAYDGLVRDTVNHGADILVIQTNNASFGRKGESQQQLAMSRLRAVEHGRATVQVSTSGESALITPDGTLLAKTGLYEAGILTAALPRRTTRTLADQAGILPEAVLIALGLTAMMAGVIHARRTRPTARTVTPPTPT